MGPLRLSVVTLPFDPECGGFDPSKLEAALGDDEVVDVVEHLVTYDGRPWWALLVTHRGGARGERQLASPRASVPLTPAPKRGRRKDWRAELDDSQKATFDLLRQWRGGRARELGVPSYVVFTNQQLAELVRRRPASLTELRSLPGIGPARLERHGAAVVKILAAAPESAGVVVAPGPAGS